MKDQTLKDVPATPTGESFLNLPTSYVVVHFAIGLENPIDDIESLKSFFSTSIMLKIPRLSSLIVEHPNGRHYFRSTKVDIDKHFIVRRLTDDDTQANIKESDYEDLINDYIAELATGPPMSTDKPLWEFHVLVDARCLVLQIHHSIGDGASLLSMIREIGSSSSGNPRKRDDKLKTKVANSKSSKPNFRLGKGEGLYGFLRHVWLTTVFGIDMAVKAFVNKDKGTMLNAKSKVGYRPNKLVTVRFNSDDVKLVKKVIPNATINDVMCGIIWGGLKKYIAARTSSGNGRAPKEAQQITGALMANIRKVAGLQELSTLMEERRFEKFWGNKSGVLLLPIRYTAKDEDALSFVRNTKSILNLKKQSAEPRLSLHFFKMVFHLFGPKVASKLMVRMGLRTTFGFSNVMGPTEQIFIAGNPVTYLRVSPSNIPLGVLVILLSYKKNLDMQIMVDDEVIPDPKFLAACFKDTFQQMMDAI